MKKIFFSIFLSLFFLIGCKSGSSIPVATSDNDVYQALKEPLIATIMYNGRTLHADEPGQQSYEYAFNGYMTDLPYHITMSRNVPFEDCAGCIGDWEEGLLSLPEYRDSFIPLQEFIIQMVRVHDTKQPNSSGDKKSPVMMWKANNYNWQVTMPDREGYWLIEVRSGLGEKWVVRTKT